MAASNQRASRNIGLLVFGFALLSSYLLYCTVEFEGASFLLTSPARLFDGYTCTSRNGILVFLVLFVLGTFMKVSNWALGQDGHSIQFDKDNRIVDRVFDTAFFRAAHAYCTKHLNVTRALLAISSFSIESTALFLIIYGYYNPVNDLRPPLRSSVALLLSYIARQMCQFMVKLPVPQGILWFNPGVPSLILDYSMTHDLFFSGHMLATSALCEQLVDFSIAYSVFLFIFQIFVLLTLRIHYFIDIYAAIATYWSFLLLYDRYLVYYIAC
jgi:hypothetical protein